MKALFLSDSFKGTLTSKEVNQIISDSFKKNNPTWEIRSYSFADGGEGTLQAIKENVEGRLQIQEDEVTGPFYDTRIKAKYGILDQKTVIIESADIIGLPLIPKEKQNPFYTTTYGIGEMIRNRIQEGYHDFILSLGGSSTNDLGAGMLSALGARFIDNMGNIYYPKGNNLLECHDIVLDDMQKRIEGVTIHVLADVDNPLLGKDGATFVFAPQKGAKEEDLPLLESGIAHIHQILKSKYQIDCSKTKEAGAAGGLGAACLSCFHADIQSGAFYLLNLIHLDQELEDTNLLFTGEGRLDASSFEGKAISSLCKTALSHHIPVYVVCGLYDESAKPLLQKYGIKDVIAVEERKDIPEDILRKYAKEHLQKRVESYIRKHHFPL